MRSKEQVRADFTQSTESLLTLLNRFPEEYFNTILIENKWTAGQITEHLIKVEVGTTRMFTGSTKKSDRDPEARIDELRDKFMDFNASLTAYGPIIPDAKPKDKQKAIDKLQDNRQRLTGMIEIEDLTKVIASFDHPLMGPLTRIEWLYFNIYHGKRHEAQIEGLLKQIK